MLEYLYIAAHQDEHFRQITSTAGACFMQELDRNAGSRSLPALYCRMYWTRWVDEPDTYDSLHKLVRQCEIGCGYDSLETLDMMHALTEYFLVWKDYEKIIITGNDILKRHSGWDKGAVALRSSQLKALAFPAIAHQAKGHVEETEACLRTVISFEGVQNTVFASFPKLWAFYSAFVGSEVVSSEILPNVKEIMESLETMRLRLQREDAWMICTT